MGKVYIGVTAVDGLKLWGVGGKKVAGLGGLGEWVSGGRLTAGGGEVAGRACPAPTGWRKGARVLAGNGQAEGSRPLPTMWKVRGWLWKARGPGMPGPYGVAEGGVGAGGGGKRSGDGTLLRLLPHTKKISLRILCKSRILLL